MHLSVRKDILFFFIFAMIAGSSIFVQADQNFCAVKVYVNDPYAKIYVDDAVIGSPPQVIDCSQKERTVTVKSSDGQIFSRLIKSYYNEYQANSTLNVIFHKKINEFIDPSSAIQSVKYNEHLQSPFGKDVNAENPSLPRRDVASQPQPSLAVADSTNVSIVQQDTPVVSKLSGFFVQLFALKNLDLSKVEKDIEQEYQSSEIDKEMIICPQRGSAKSQITSLVLVGPFKDKSSAFVERKRIGGKSFVVLDPLCFGDYQKVSR